jgi:hypothetical protein
MVWFNHAMDIYMMIAPEEYNNIVATAPMQVSFKSDDEIEKNGIITDEGNYNEDYDFVW